MFVVGTKLDAAQDADRRASLERLAAERGLPFYAISSVTGEGIEALRYAMGELLLSRPPE
jgi:GTP-binding protein